MSMSFVLGVVGARYYVWIMCGVCVRIIVFTCCLWKCRMWLQACVDVVCVGCCVHSILCVDYVRRVMCTIVCTCFCVDLVYLFKHELIFFVLGVVGFGYYVRSMCGICGLCVL